MARAGVATWETENGEVSDVPPTKRYRLYLISPSFKYKHYATQHELSQLVGKKRMTIPIQLSLLAAMTPDHWDVRVIDDECDDLVLDPLPDVVGITCMGATMDRVNEISDLYRSRGASVILGGVYPTFAPEQSLRHADHLVMGEAEGVWQQFLADFERGRARQIYQREEPPEFRTSPHPPWDLIDIDNAMTICVETSRGCPFNCDFCVVNKMFGRKMRFRDVDDVVAEIESAPIKRIFFVADNFAMRKSYAYELVARLKPLEITWACQSSIHVADDPELLQEMAEAGCTAILIGFESLNPAALKGAKKHHNHIEDYERAIQRVHAVGIHVYASFIIGFDEDDIDTFELIEEFIERNDLLFSMLNIMSIAPGTAMYTQMKEAGRLNAVEPAYRNGIFPCMDYNNFSQREIFDAFFRMARRLIDWRRLRGRAGRLFGSGTFAARSPEQVALFEKVGMMAMLSRRFLLSRDADKRGLFLDLMEFVKQGRLAPEKMVTFLLNMEAFHQFFRDAEAYTAHVRAQITRVDRGPWCEQTGAEVTPGAIETNEVHG